jgi:hypothetical protein
MGSSFKEVPKLLRLKQLCVIVCQHIKPDNIKGNIYNKYNIMMTKYLFNPTMPKLSLKLPNIVAGKIDSEPKIPERVLPPTPVTPTDQVRVKTGALRRVITKGQIHNEMDKQESKNANARGGDKAPLFHFDTYEDNCFPALENGNHANGVHACLKALIIDQEFQDKCDLEFEMLIKRIGSLDAAHPGNSSRPTSTEEIVDRGFKRNNEYKFNNNFSGLSTEKGIKHISLGEVFTNLVEYLTQGEEFIAYDLIMVGFKIFIKYIQTDGKNSLATDEDSETDMDADLKAKNTLIHKQNTLLQYNTCDLIFKTIKNDYAIIIKEQALILGIEILEGGNYNAQMTFLQYIKDDVDNEFLIAIKQLLDNSFELIKKYMLSKNDI